MDDLGIDDALRPLRSDEIDAIERFIRRIQQEGWIRPEVARRWKVALDRAPGRHPRVAKLR
jgi:hypothetical protein